MSLVGLPVQGVEDPLLRFAERKQIMVPFGGDDTTWNQISCNGTPSTTLLNFNIQPPSGVAIDPKIRMFWDITLAFSGTSASGNLLQMGTSDGPRAFPIASAIGPSGSILVQINGDSSSQQMDVFTALNRFGDFGQTEKGEWSMTPAMQDEYQQYNDWVTYGSARNPLANYGERSDRPNRGGFAGMTVLTNTPTSATVRLQVCEPLFLSPLAQWGSQVALGQIQTFTIAINIGSISRMWSHDAIGGNPLTFVNATFNSSPQILMKYVTPKLDINALRLQNPYTDIRTLSTPGLTPLAPGASATYSLSSQNINNIPHKMYFFCRPNNASLDMTVSDASFLTINVFQLNWNNKSAQFTSASIRDLYEVAYKAGLQFSWSDWIRFKGSIFCITPGVDFPLNEGESPGMEQKITFNAIMNVTNPNTNPSAPSYTYDAYCVCETRGVYTLENLRVTKQITTLTSEDVFQAASKPKISWDSFQRASGGGLWDTLKNLASKGMSTIESVIPYAQKGIQAYQQHAPAIRKMFGGSGFACKRQKTMSGAGFIDDSDRDQYKPAVRPVAAPAPVRRQSVSGLPIRGRGGSSMALEADGEDEEPLALPHH